MPSPIRPVGPGNVRSWRHRLDRQPGAAPAGEPDGAPQHAPIVLVALILVAAVANLNLAVANVALPDIGKAFDSSQTTLNLIAVGLLARSRGVGALPRRARATGTAAR